MNDTELNAALDEIAALAFEATQAISLLRIKAENVVVEAAGLTRSPRRAASFIQVSARQGTSAKSDLSRICRCMCPSIRT